MTSGRVLVTGASGFVGRALVPHLLLSGHGVTLATRSRHDPGLDGDLRCVTVGPIGPDTDWSAALDGVGSVLHLAAHVHVAPERAAREGPAFDGVNRAGSLRLYEASAAHGVGRFVFVSSITVLGDATTSGRPFSDETPTDPRTPYGRSKRDAEDALREAARKPNHPELVILRPPLICGPGVKGNLASLARLASLPLPLPLGGIRNRRTLLSLDNLADAVATVLDAPAGTGGGTFVLGDAEPVSTTDMVRRLAEGRARAPRLWPAPVAVLSRIARWTGRAGQAQRLFGDLEVDSSGFRRAYGWSDVVDTASSLRACAEQARGPALSR